jgi:hypothetical protein
LNNPPKDGGLVGVTAGTSSGEKSEKEGKKPMTASDACCESGFLILSLAEVQGVSCSKDSDQEIEKRCCCC